ncbi:hypothetical protein [Streptomyces uncialis]|uniref:Uncharacterized protein n=1 Tax=Streptomyces uncialis TaxID=1048205 RepID=A0A1Q4UZI9_9ACTN|nr:hypothetical protein [Streptomyces uncialis]OKH90980.1 hypothetical protein AB852_31245 [Streptomyces uncialis]
MSTVFAEYHLFRISDPGGAVTDDIDASLTGLVAADDGSIEILTGIHTGDVSVSFAPHTGEPALAPGQWEEIAEISFHSPTGEVVLHSLTGDGTDPLPLAAGPGDYRLRVAARGRDTAVDTTVETVVEWYRIDCWPAPPQPPALVRTGDRYGADQRAVPRSATRIINHGPQGQAAIEHDILKRAEQDDHT